MDVIVSARHMELSDQLKQTATDKISRLSRFLNGMDYAEVHFAEERNPRIRDKEVCEVTMEGHGHHIRARVSAPDPFTAVDLVVDKLEHQLHKLKTKVLRRAHARTDGSVDSETPVDGLAPTDEGSDGDGLRIVKTKRFMMKPMSPEEAALQMDLVGHDFFFFTNSETHRAAVLYRRRSGDLGLIDEAG